MVLGSYNTLYYPPGDSQVTQSIIIGDNNNIGNEVTNIFVIGRSNYTNGSNTIVAGTNNYADDNYCLVAGTDNTCYALGQTIFGSHHNSTSASYDMRYAEYALISGVSNFANGKAASVLGDNLLGSRETGSLTIGTFNEGNSGSVFEVGNGYMPEGATSPIRQNILELNKNGALYGIPQYESGASIEIGTEKTVIYPKRDTSITLSNPDLCDITFAVLNKSNKTLYSYHTTSKFDDFKLYFTDSYSQNIGDICYSISFKITDGSSSSNKRMPTVTYTPNKDRYICLLYTSPSPRD